MAVAPAPTPRRPTSRRRSPRWCSQFADEQILPNAEHYDGEDEYPEPIVEQMKELGLFGVTIPEEYGGMGLDLTTYAMIVEELSRGWISISGVINTHFIGSYLLMKFGSEEQKQKYLPRMATGEIRAAFSLSEPELGSDVQAIKTSAKKARGRLVGDQRPEDVGHQRADVLARVRARQDRPRGRSPRHKGFTCFIAEKEPGRGREHRRLRRPERARRRSRSSATRASSPPSWCSTATSCPAENVLGGEAAGPEQGLRADDGRAGGRPRQRRRARRRHRPARAGAGAALLAGAQDLRQADRRAPGDPVQARRHGHPGRCRAPAHAARRAPEGRRRALGPGGRHGQAVRLRGGRASASRSACASTAATATPRSTRSSASTATRRCC